MKSERVAQKTFADNTIRRGLICKSRAMEHLTITLDTAAATATNLIKNAWQELTSPRTLPRDEWGAGDEVVASQRGEHFNSTSDSRESFRAQATWASFESFDDFSSKDFPKCHSALERTRSDNLNRNDGVRQAGECWSNSHSRQFEFMACAVRVQIWNRTSNCTANDDDGHSKAMNVDGRCQIHTRSRL